MFMITYSHLHQDKFRIGLMSLLDDETICDNKIEQRFLEKYPLYRILEIQWSPLL